MALKIAFASRYAAQAGRGEALARALAEAGAGFAALPGVELWLVLRVPGDPDAVIVWEVYGSEQSRAATPLDMTRVAPLLAGPPELTPLAPYAGKGLSLWQG